MSFKIISLKIPSLKIISFKIYILLILQLIFSCKKKTIKQNNISANNYVGIFYHVDFGDSLNNFYKVKDISPASDVWLVDGQTPSYGDKGSLNFWGKPAWAASHGDGTVKNNYVMYLNGNVNTPNDSLLYYHANLLSQAGVDFVVIGLTNGLFDVNGQSSFISGTQALCASWSKRMMQGLPTPQIVLWVRNESDLLLCENLIYNKFPSGLFFNYLGKKLLLVVNPNDSLSTTDPNQPAVPTEGDFANYTARHCWGLQNIPSFWQFKINDSIPPGPFMYNGQPEEMCATLAVQATYMTVDGINPDKGAIGRQNGAYFIKYVNAAIAAKPKFLFINGWNEWHALNVGTQQIPFLTDQWNQEYSSDTEPMSGGFGDQYYQLLKQEVAAFKAVK